MRRRTKSLVPIVGCLLDVKIKKHVEEARQLSYCGMLFNLLVADKNKIFT